MNYDIVSIQDGLDMGIAVTDVSKAANVLSVQLGDLEYAQDFGVDLRYFLTNNLQFQNESFKAYLVERLTTNQINVVNVVEVLNTLFSQLTFSVGDAANESKGFIL